MFRRGRLQRSLITLLALLIVTPQVLLRPCCCAQERIAVSAASGSQSIGKPVENRALPPCCQKRLQAAQKAATAIARTPVANSRPGIHDSGRCGCRVANQVARTNRTVFNGIVLRHLVVWMSQNIEKTAAGELTQSQVLTTAAHSGFPDSGPEACARLCRWVV